MASLPTKGFNQIVTDTIAGIQGRASKFIDFSEGSPLRAIVEGFAGLFLWFQAQVLKLLQAMRLSTAQDVDVDTFTADFMTPVGTSNGVASPRLAAQKASGNVTFTRFTAAPVTCFIAVGKTVGTNDGTNTQFEVVANTTFPTFSVPLNGYTLASSVASIVVPVAAVVAGKAGNIVSGAISQITSPIQGIDTVTNTAAFVNGADFESDSALKKRFADYILGLSRGDYYGTAASIEGAAVNVEWTITENYTYDGEYKPGYYFIVADDGSGSPTPEFMTLVTNAVNAVRPLGIQAAVFEPVVLFANVSMQITTAPNYDHNTVVAQVAALVALNINDLGVGNSLAWSILSAWAYSVPGVTTVAAVLLNGNATDAASLSATRLTQDGKFNIGYATIKAGTMTIS